MPTDFVQGNGKCVRCSHSKEAPGWRTRTTPAGVEIRTPLGWVYRSSPPPLLGWGSDPPDGPARGHPAAVLEDHLEALLGRAA